MTKYFLSIILVVLIFVYFSVNTNYLDFLKIQVDYSKKWQKERYNKEKKEIAKLRSKADSGNLEAQFRIGLLCLDNAHLNYDKALKYLKMSAEHGDSRSQLLLGDMYHHGLGIDKNDVEALNWYSKSAEQENIIARDNLIAFYLEGNEVEKEKAISLLQKFADQEDIFVEYLIFYFWEPLGLKLDYEKTFKIFSNPPTYSFYENIDLYKYSLAYMYEHGLGTEQNLEMAKSIYNSIGSETIKRFKKMQKNPFEDIQHTLGIIYYNTDFSGAFHTYGVYNYKKALYYYTESTEKRNSDSYLLLYSSFYYKDKKKALNYLKRAGELGNLTAIDYLENKYLNGDSELGIKKNSAEAFKWYYKAYYKFGDIDSLFDLAFLYYCGKGVKRDYKKAFNLFYTYSKRNVQFNNPKIIDEYRFTGMSEFMMAYMYEEGLGVEKDIYRALESYVYLAEQNLKLAQYRLACIYEQGKDVKQDKREAEYWYSKIGSEEEIKKCKQFINDIKTGQME